MGVGFPPWGFGSGGQPVVIPPSSLGQGGTIPVTGSSLQLPLPEVLPIPSAKEFNPLGQKATVGAENNTVITGTVLDIPDSTFGVIRGVSLYITNMLTTTNVVWSLIVENATPQGFNQLTIFPRAAPFVSNGFDSMIRFNGPARIQVIFSNLDGGAYTVGASFSGWFWPTGSDAIWRRFGGQG